MACESRANRAGYLTAEEEPHIYLRMTSLSLAFPFYFTTPPPTGRGCLRLRD